MYLLSVGLFHRSKLLKAVLVPPTVAMAEVKYHCVGLKEL